MERSTVHIVSETKKKIPVSVLIVPTIAAPIRCASLRSAAKLPYLNGLNLAHRVTSDTSFQISLLVGADHYWDFVEDRVVRGNGPTAVKSKIGYLLSSPMPPTSQKPTEKHILKLSASCASNNSKPEQETKGVSLYESDRKSVDYHYEDQTTSHPEPHPVSGSNTLKIRDVGKSPEEVQRCRRKRRRQRRHRKRRRGSFSLVRTCYEL